MILVGSELAEHLSTHHDVPRERVLLLTEFRRRLLHADRHPAEELAAVYHLHREKHP